MNTGISRWAFVLVAAMVGCATEPDADIGSAEQPLNWPQNGAGPDAVNYGAVIANEANNLLFATSSLTQALEDPAFHTAAVGDPLSREFLLYWANCALSAGHHYTVPGYQLFPALNLDGSLGLCDYAIDASMSNQCLESVSACILDQINLTRSHVIHSQRGPTPNGTWVRNFVTGQIFWQQLDLAVKTLLPAISETVKPPSTENPDESIAPVESAKACTQDRVYDRDCGWHPLYVGQAQAGTTVTLSATASSSNTGDTMLRVCLGYQMCDQAAAFKFNDDTAYNERRPTVTFTLPTAGNGVYSVMWAPYWSGDTSATVSSLSSTTAGNNAYPVSELGTFSVREGSFYGTIFRRSAAEHLNYSINWDPAGYCPGSVGPPTRGCRTQTVNLPPGVTSNVVFPNMFVCTAPGWADPVGYATKRLCTSETNSGGQRCPGVNTGSCSARCTYRSSDQTWRSCTDLSSNVWQYPLTSSVHAPCDIISPLNPNEPACALAIQ